jgi:hypothetical protein
MKTNILATAVALSDRDLLARIDALATKEREATAELIAHLAALELRPNLYLAQGYGSLFAYCTDALHLSEDAACNRIDAARACRRFPAILDLLAVGSLTLTSVRMLKGHLMPENHEVVLARASNRTKEEIAVLIAELAPKPDVPATVRKLPGRKVTEDAPPDSAGNDGALPPASPTRLDPGDREGQLQYQAPPAEALHPTPRPIVQPLSPQRYRVQFTIGQETHDKLRRVQALLRRDVPSGDPGVIFDRFLDLLLEKIERTKLGKTPRPRRRPPEGAPAGRAYENRIRPGTDKSAASPDNRGVERRGQRSRHIPNEVKRAVWWRDKGQCAFVSCNGRRCMERNFLELHHIQPYAMEGSATVGNVALRCRRHNQYEAELVFGPRPHTVVTPG